MSAFGDELHKLLSKLKGGEELAQHEVETLVQEFLTHVQPAISQLREEVTRELTTAVETIKADLANAIAEIKGVAKPTDAPQGNSGDTAPVEGETPAVPAETPAQPAE